MKLKHFTFRIILLTTFVFFLGKIHAQPSRSINWAKEGHSYYQITGEGIIEITLPKYERKTVLSAQVLSGSKLREYNINSFQLSADGKKILIFANSKKVWRYQTRGDYYVADLTTNKVTQIGKDQPLASLMFAKFSPDGLKVAYVSKNNLYVEDLATGENKALTIDGTARLINGTFDWAYEEEFNCRDGFKWSPDGTSIAYWQLDASKIKNFLMINNTDSIYPFTIPVEYPKVGQDPSSARIGVVQINTAKTNWIAIPGDKVQNYIPRMDWVPNSNSIIIQQINREQNQTNLFIADIKTAVVKNIYSETDKAWVDAGEPWQWINDNKEFIWLSEKDGWKHYYRIHVDGKKENLITKGDYDVIKSVRVDEKNNAFYFMASPENATQKYLYTTKLDGKGKLERVTPSVFPGTHSYDISPDGIYALHGYQTANIRPIQEWMNMSTGNALTMNGSMTNQLGSVKPPKNKVEFFKIKTEDGVEMDGWMKKPDNFDRTKKYPVLFYVYGEPGGATVTDTYGVAQAHVYAGDLAKDGYIYISLDNRGTPAPKGRAWRKGIYQNIGRLNIRDQAMAAKKIMEWSFVDKDRIAVWGWSGGGSSTLNLLFQYPDIFKTGIAIAAVANQLTYDNIYQERYMGSPLKTQEAYVLGSPIHYAKNLKGNLLYIHGTGDDNVHYQNAEMLINKLIKNRKVFQLMAYPNRSHSINEGEGTNEHLALTFTKFLKDNCPPGGR